MPRFLPLLTLLIWLLISPVARANGLSLGTAADFTTGNYGGIASTDIWYVPFTARYDKDRASFRIIVPYLDITGPGNVLGPGIGGIDGRSTLIGGGFTGSNPGSGGGIVVCDENSENCSGENPGRSSNNPDSGSGNSDGSGDSNDDDSGGDDDSDGEDDGSEDDGSDDGDDEDETLSRIKLRKAAATGLIGGVPLGGPDLPSSTRSGLGDIVTAFSYNLIDHAPSGIMFDITARLKIPTASERQNMGTGKVDYAIQGDLFKTISKLTLSATLGYRILGNPSGITFHNVIYGGVGVGYRLSPAVTLGTSYTMGKSPVRLEESRDLTFYLSQRVTQHFRLNVYGLRGFSDRSPDWGGGINVRYVF